MKSSAVNLTQQVVPDEGCDIYPGGPLLKQTPPVGAADISSYDLSIETAEEKKRETEETAKASAVEEARKKAEADAEAKKRAKAEGRAQKEAKIKASQEEEARIRKEAEQREKAEAEARKKAEAQKKPQAEAEARTRQAGELAASVGNPAEVVRPPSNVRVTSTGTGLGVSNAPVYRPNWNLREDSRFFQVASCEEWLAGSIPPAERVATTARDKTLLFEDGR